MSFTKHSVYQYQNQFRILCIHYVVEYNNGLHVMPHMTLCKCNLCLINVPQIVLVDCLYLEQGNSSHVSASQRKMHSRYRSQIFKKWPHFSQYIWIYLFFSRNTFWTLFMQTKKYGQCEFSAWILCGKKNCRSWR